MGGLRRLRVATQVESTVIGTMTFPRIGPVNRVAKWPASARRAGSEPSRGNTSRSGKDRSGSSGRSDGSRNGSGRSGRSGRSGSGGGHGNNSGGGGVDGGGSGGCGSSRYCVCLLGLLTMLMLWCS